MQINHKHVLDKYFGIKTIRKAKWNTMYTTGSTSIIVLARLFIYLIIFMNLKN